MCVCSSTTGQLGVPFLIALHYRGTATHWPWSSSPRLTGQWTPGILLCPPPQCRGYWPLHLTQGFTLYSKCVTDCSPSSPTPAILSVLVVQRLLDSWWDFTLALIAQCCLLTCVQPHSHRTENLCMSSETLRLQWFGCLKWTWHSETLVRKFTKIQSVHVFYLYLCYTFRKGKTLPRKVRKECSGLSSSNTLHHLWGVLVFSCRHILGFWCCWVWASLVLLGVRWWSWSSPVLIRVVSGLDHSWLLLPNIKMTLWLFAGIVSDFFFNQLIV